MDNQSPAVPKKYYWLKGLLAGLAVSVAFSLYKALGSGIFLTNKACACLGSSASPSLGNRVAMFAAVFIMTGPLAMLLGSAIGLFAEKKLKSGFVVLGIFVAIVVAGILLGIR